MLLVRGLEAGYGGLRVLNGLDISVGENEVVALIGPNGAGKTTLIKSIFGLTDIHAGKILFGSADITRLPAFRRIDRGICYVPQEMSNFPDMTIEENLRLGASRTATRRALRERLDYVYSEFPVLSQRRKEQSYGLSGGQQRLLALARVLMRDPSLLLLDEPSLGLSPKATTLLFDMIRRIRKEGVGILIAEQNARKAVELADRICVMENGKIVLEGGRELIPDAKIKEVYLGG